MKTITINTSKPKIPYDGWTIEHNNDQGKIKFDPSKLSLHLEPEQEKGHINGKTLAERFKTTGLSSVVLDYLWEHQDQIPESWKEKKDGYIQFIYFWGTIFRSAGGSLCVQCVFWEDGAWRRNYNWLGNVWNSNYPAAELASISTLKPKPSSLKPLNLVLPEILEINGIKYRKVK